LLASGQLPRRDQNNHEHIASIFLSLSSFSLPLFPRLSLVLSFFLSLMMTMTVMTMTMMMMMMMTMTVMIMMMMMMMMMTPKSSTPNRPGR
jgi:hypothetical protein